MPPSSNPDYSSCYNFPALIDFAESIIQDSIVKTLEGKNYDDKRVSTQTNSINSDISKQLSASCPNFKYIVSTLIVKTSEDKPANIVQNVGGTWSEGCDGVVDLTWESEAMSCVVTVMGILL
ncbi:hypothetical protein TrST_g13912 [Triparma strigata]|uniref:Uncharacterized protein n=1 Tax=Triparma strigata TaxID=1606541 RepID=A0A9W7B9L5_9STRA|nr:hypothetical protein TrST_g13912 [Triparma strigata]